MALRLSFAIALVPAVAAAGLIGVAAQPSQAVIERSRKIQGGSYPDARQLLGDLSGYAAFSPWPSSGAPAAKITLSQPTNVDGATLTWTGGAAPYAVGKLTLLDLQTRVIT